MEAAATKNTRADASSTVICKNHENEGTKMNKKNKHEIGNENHDKYFIFNTLQGSDRAAVLIESRRE